MKKFVIINTKNGEFLAGVQYSSWTADVHSAVQFTQEENARMCAILIYEEYSHIEELAIQCIDVNIQFRDGGQVVTYSGEK